MSLSDLERTDKKRPITIIIDDDDEDENENKNSKTNKQTNNNNDTLNSINSIISLSSTSYFIASNSIHSNKRHNTIEEYTDSIFPPHNSSLGRISSNSYPISSFCKCSLKCVMKTVNKDGPNQGRFFLACVMKKCNYFSWVNKNDIQFNNSTITWKRFRWNEGWCMVTNRGFRPDDVKQGKLGDCWLLSALAVVASRTDLIQQLVIHDQIPDNGHMTFRLFIDGFWQSIDIDNYLPCLQNKDNILAFSGIVQKQLWAPLIEKAYAKAHCTYGAIIGGQVAEALLDLTGAPCETIEFSHPQFDSELTWSRLQSFCAMKFPIGAATSSTGEGIVGHHAYSVLDVRVLTDVKLGQQRSMNDYIVLPNITNSTKNSSWYYTGEDKYLESTSQNNELRLLRVRNPWGKKEWSGDFSSSSDKWTSKLRVLLRQEDKDDGIFWITYQDFLRRFDQIDVCKAYNIIEGWTGISVSGDIVPFSVSTKQTFSMEIFETTFLFLWLIQKTKRGKSDEAGKNYWYTDLSFILSEMVTGKIVACQFNQPCRDTIPLEISLPPGLYTIHIAHFNAQFGESFALRAYTSLPICLTTQIASNNSNNNSLDIIIKKCLSVNSNMIHDGMLRCLSLWSRSTEKGELSVQLITGNGIRFLRIDNITNENILLNMQLHCIGYKVICSLSAKVNQNDDHKDNKFVHLFECVVPAYHQVLLVTFISCTDNSSSHSPSEIALIECAYSTVEHDTLLDNKTVSENLIPLFKPFSIF